MEKTAYNQLETQQKHHEDKEKVLKKAIQDNKQTISEFQKTIKVCFFFRSVFFFFCGNLSEYYY